MLYTLIDHGMNVARLNMSHGSHEFHAQTISNLKSAQQKFWRQNGFAPNVAIALDTKGPEIRTGVVDGVSQRTLTVRGRITVRLGSTLSRLDLC